MSEEQKKKGGVIFAVCFALVGVLLLCIMLIGDNPAEQYLGKWKGRKKGDVFKIDRLPSKLKRPIERVPLFGGDTAKLLLPTLIRNVPSCWHGVVGGIYDVNGDHALIIWCRGADHNVVTAIERSGPDLRVGLIEKFNSLKRQMCVGHDDSHNRYRPIKWLTYNRVSR